jgi:putative hydrolase of the HAD superfamily
MGNMRIDSNTALPIRAVIVDIGGVLFLGPPWVDFRARWARRLGITPEWLDAHIWYGPEIEAANIGQLTAEDYYQRCACRLGCDPVEVGTMIAEVFSGERLNDELVRYIRTLKQRVRVAALTNTWSFGRELIARRGIGDLFDLVVSSSEEGVKKPYPRIYEITCERLGVVPAEAVFVDDTAENVEAARALGMRGILFCSTEQTIAALGALG